MKNRHQKYYPFVFVLSLMAFLLLNTSILSGQDEEIEKKKVRLSLEYHHVTDSVPYLMAVVKTRVDRIYETVPDIHVKFYRELDEGRSLLGEAISNQKGEAILQLDPSVTALPNALVTQNFIATIENNQAYEDADQDIAITASKMDMTVEMVDSTKMINVFFGMPDSNGILAPVEGTFVNFFVKRMFGALPFGDDYEMTNEEGIVSVALPHDIPGDQNGNLKIIAKTEDDAYGVRSVEKIVSWGVPLTVDENVWKETLWSARKNTPLILIIVVNTVLIGIWGIIIYIVIQLFKIRKLGKTAS